MKSQSSVGSKPFRVVIIALLLLSFLVALAVLIVSSTREPVVLDSYSNGSTNVVLKMISVPADNSY